jgi:hypothetical protein
MICVLDLVSTCIYFQCSSCYHYHFYKSLCPSSSNHEDERYLITLGPFGCIFKLQLRKSQPFCFDWYGLSTKLVAKSTVNHKTQQRKTHNNQHEPTPTYPSAALPSISMATSTMASNKDTLVPCESVASTRRWVHARLSLFLHLGHRRIPHQQKLEQWAWPWP